jgi:hypothetical protein
VGATQGSVRWGIERRLEFIKFRLFWEGHVNRGDLMAAFGISIKASTDLNRYLGMAPDNMLNDKSASAYVRGDRFQPLFLKPDPASYLSQLRSISDGIVTQEETWIGHCRPSTRSPAPFAASMPIRCATSSKRSVPGKRLRSSTSPFPTPPHAGAGSRRMRSRSTISAGMPGRTASPTAVSRTSCSRILGVRDSRPSDIDAGQDLNWHTHVTLEIGPYPGLSDAQKKVIALDYSMRDGKASMTVRRALLYYTLKRLGQDTDPAARKPSDQQITLLNQEVISMSGHSPPSLS